MDAFQKETLRVNSTKRCLQTSPGAWNLPLGGIYFGVPESKFFGWTPFETLPETVEYFSFYLGSDCLSLIKAFVDSKFTNEVKRLAIGDSSFRLGVGRDYEEISDALAESEYPNLKIFEFGVWELFSNSHCAYGKLGNVTRCLQKMPNLEALYLYGAFQIDESLSFSNLKILHVTLDDLTTGINGGYISQETLDKLLGSDFPSLEEICMDLDCEDNHKQYAISELFLTGEKVPKLQQIEFVGGFRDGEIERARNSKLCSKKDVFSCFEEPD